MMTVMRTIAKVLFVVAQTDPEPVSKLVLTAVAEAVANTLASQAAQDAYEYARERWRRADG